MTDMRFAAVILLLALAGCAGQRPPEGGPLDTTPPEILSIYPAPNTINFDGDRIAVEFSEYVDRRSVEDAVFISPAIEDAEFEWSGTEMELVFTSPLRTNTTYVVTIGTDVADHRNRNRMAHAVTIAFSTGPAIDRGAVEGRIYDDAPQGVMIFSYRTDGIKADTLNPVVTKPDYITQAGTDGTFRLTNIAPGTYRLFAVKDEYRNLLYDPETDAAGAAADITLTQTDTLTRDVRFILALEDTTAPRLQSVTAPDDRHLTVQFSEPVDSASVASARFSVTDTNGVAALPLLSLFRAAAPANAYTVVTGVQTRDSQYVLSVDGVRDKAGFPINPLARAKSFKGAAVPDTMPPGIVSISVGGPSGTLLPGAPVLIHYDDAVTLLEPDSLVRFVAMKDTAAVPVTVAKTSPASIAVIPVKPVRSGESYVLEHHHRFLRDTAGNRRRDSVSVYPFTGDDPERFGSIAGNAAGLSGSAPKVVQAFNMNDRKQPPLTVTVGPNGTFQFTMMPEGRYALRMFDDRNGNGTHDAGRLYPHERGERFIIGKDTVRVRARWPVDGVFLRE